MDEQGRQCVAAHCRHARWHAKRAWPRHPVWKHRQEEVGRQLGLHGPVRLCSRLGLLGRLGLPNVIRHRTIHLPRPAQCGLEPNVPIGTSIPWENTKCDHGLFSIRVRSNHVDFDRWGFVRKDEFPCMDVVRAALGDIFIPNNCL